MEASWPRNISSLALLSTSAVLGFNDEDRATLNARLHFHTEFLLSGADLATAGGLFLLFKNTSKTTIYQAPWCSDPNSA